MTAVDLARFRVIYAVVGLLTVPSFAWVAAYPDAMYAPPPGPMQVFGGFPDAWVLHGLELVAAAAFAALLVGYRVGLASVTATLAMLIGYGFAYSLGKIDHNVLFIFTPAVLAAAGWSGRGTVRPTVLRLWAFSIGLALLSAGLAKVLAGWLDPSTQATHGSALLFVHAYDRSGLLTTLTLRSDVRLWEPFDVAAVVLECGFVLTVFSWVWFRRGLAMLCLFHVGVLLLFGIPFGHNVLAYAAFVPWSRLPWPEVRRLSAWWVVPLVPMAWGLGQLGAPPVAEALVVLGGCAGGWYLVRGAGEWLLARSRRRADVADARLDPAAEAVGERAEA